MSYEAETDFKQGKFAAIKGVVYSFESEADVKFLLDAKWIKKSTKNAQAHVPDLHCDPETIWHDSGKKVMK